MAPPRCDPVTPFREAVEETLGLRVPADGPWDLAALLAGRLVATGRSAPAYVAALRSGRERAEAWRLREQLTVGETYFHRDAGQLAAIADVVLPDLVERPAGGAPRILSAGCSTGEEPYTLAMLLASQLPNASAQRAAIVGIDVHPERLEHARRGRYGPWSLRQLAPALRSRHFTGSGRELRLDSVLRRMVRFEERDLLEDDPGFWSPGAFDLILCRNVIMYFTAAAARQVVARLCGSLSPGGYLFLGHAETLRGVSDELELRRSADAFFYQRPTSARRAGRSPPRGAASSAGPGAAPAATAGEGEEPGAGPSRAAPGQADPELAPVAPRRPAPVTPRRDAPGPPGGAAQLPRVSPAADLAAASPLLQAWAALAVGQPAAALELLDGAGAADLAAPETLLVRAALRVERGELALARAHLEELIRLGALDAGTSYLLGVCDDASGSAAGATRHYQGAVVLDPTFSLPRLRLGGLLAQAGDREGARRSFARALELLVSETEERLLLYGGGFQRDGLVRLCAAGLEGLERRP